MHEKLATNGNSVLHHVKEIIAATLEIMEISDDIVEREQEEDVIFPQEEVKEEEEEILVIPEEEVLEVPEEEILIIKEIKEVKKSEKREEADKKIATLLHEKGLSENLIQTMINTGLTDEHIRLLKALNFNDDDIDNLQDLWQTKIKLSESEDSVEFTISDELLLDARAHVSPNIMYLKKVLSKPLIQALREILLKKPTDPVEYLGHWLLHFKICEERDLQQKQRDLELLMNREILQRKLLEDIKVEVDVEVEVEEKEFIEAREEEEEEIGEDWMEFSQYINYKF